MPRERQDLFRESKVQEKEKIIVLAFEGKKTEEIYFEELKSSIYFNEKLIHLHLLKRGSDDNNSSPSHVFKKLKSEAKDIFNFNKDDELWMIIDKDRWRNIPEIIEKCKAEGNMHVAGSNPCFEMWLILHVQNFDDINEEDRNKLIDNIRVSRKRRFTDKYLSDILGEYNKTNPKPERFIEHINLAIEQGKKLNPNNEDFPSQLGSHVYKIVEKLITNNL